MMLQAVNLTKRFGRVVALRNVSFEADAGRVAIIGQNGSGKSTLLSIMFGALRPTEGVLRVDGYEPYKLRERASKDMSIVFERPTFDISVRVRDVYEVLSGYGDSDCLSFFWEGLGVRDFRNTALPDLSSGEKQLVQLMQAFCRESKLKILDEPFSHVDVRHVGLIGDYILRRGFSVVFTTHVPEEAEWLGEYFVMLRDGEVVWHGGLSDLEREGVYEVYLRGEPPEGVEVLAKFGYVAIVRSDYDELVELVRRGRVRGFRRLGVRRYF